MVVARGRRETAQMAYVNKGWMDATEQKLLMKRPGVENWAPL